MMKSKWIWMALALINCMSFTHASAKTTAPPNVLLIAVDDLNDWIGCMGGHPQVQTPNIDRLADRGVLFSNAHCQSPVCNPSRASLMTGLYPETTGIYFLTPPLRKSPVVDEDDLMPRRFEREGYHVAAAGKLFHGRDDERYFKNFAGKFGGFGPLPDKKLSPFPGPRIWDWGTFPERDDQMSDHKIASWAGEQLEQEFDKPFFLGVGFMTPHVPQFAPKKWMDLYPLDTLRLPEVIENDLADVPRYGINLTRLEHIAPTQEWVVENNQWKPLVQTYLACVSFLDAQVGRVLDALDNSPYADNTIVVLFSDHGFHLGEKERWAKRSIWQDGGGAPLIIAGPGIAGGKVCDKPVQLLDIYPTLLDLAGRQADSKHEGHSLKPLLENPAAEWPHTARCSFGPKNVAIISGQYRYIHYSDGSEELYDRLADPHEWHNLADNPDMKRVLEQHRKELPTQYHPVLGEESTGHKAYRAAEAAKVAGSQSPNLVFVFADQWRAAATGYAGDPNLKGKTPNLDKLAKNGVWMQTAVSTMPVCTPYRASLLTGQYALSHGLFLNDAPLNPELNTIGKVYKAAGYDTGYVGKWHVDGHGRSSFIPPERQHGFDYWKVLECTHSYNNSPYYEGDSRQKKTWEGYDAAAQTRDVQNYITEHANGPKPFAVFLSWGPPHGPYKLAPKNYEKQFRPETIQLRPNVPAEEANAARIAQAGYYAHIIALDEYMGDLLKTIDEAGIADNTVFVFTSDHGDMLGAHAQQKKQQPYDESCQVPFLVRYPAGLGREGRQIDMPFGTPDIMPTLLGLCGLEIPKSVEGTDYSRVLAGKAKPENEAALIECIIPFGNWNRRQGGREFRGIRTRRYTYVRDLDGPWLLFDNENDPYQMKNLVGLPEHKSLQERLDEVLADKLRDRKDEFLHGDEYIKQWGYKVNRIGNITYAK